ncbi:type 1 fimbria pilin [Acinetobacter calcoaceticus]|uniref:Type 1 fimbria pilin n=1 Tax=Acinetobacter calcoaceticus TaxID=471 RepID=A0A4R1XNQ7_ACICA|nr:type 1 fimbria pilin [Acinetobacter calcoaceticus]
MPTYYTPGSFEYAYALIDNETGLPFRHGPGQDIPIKGKYLTPRNATLIFYAAKDNPTKTTYFSQRYFGVILASPYGNGVGTTAVGYSYMVSFGSINPPKASCTAENSNNLSIQLPRSPLSAFPEVGSSYATAKDQIVISCTGKMSATMKLNLGADQIALDSSGQATVIKNKLDTADAAQGIGFVLNDHSGKRLINNEVIRLASLDNGRTQLPIYAQYYRYAEHIKPGRTEATAGFTLSFN